MSYNYNNRFNIDFNNFDFDNFDLSNLPGNGKFSQFFNSHPQIQKGVNGVLGDVQLITNYERNKNIAITTGVFAIVALVAAVALFILFPPSALILGGIALAGAACLALTITSAVHIDRARKGNEVRNELINNPFKLMNHFLS